MAGKIVPRPIRPDIQAAPHQPQQNQSCLTTSPCPSKRRLAPLTIHSGWRCCSCTASNCGSGASREASTARRCCCSTASAATSSCWRRLRERMPERESHHLRHPGRRPLGAAAPPDRLPRHRSACGDGSSTTWSSRQADVLGISWGGAAAQQFARTCRRRCRRLIVCATATGTGDDSSASGRCCGKMATPRRFIERRILAQHYRRHLRRRLPHQSGAGRHLSLRTSSGKSKLGYYLQLLAVSGWTSIHWLPGLRQPTLLMAGADDPLVPLAECAADAHADPAVGTQGLRLRAPVPDVLAPMNPSRPSREFLDRP